MQASAIAWAEGFVEALADCDETLCVASAGSIANDVAVIVAEANAQVSEAACAGTDAPTPPPSPPTCLFLWPLLVHYIAIC